MVKESRAVEPWMVRGDLPIYALDEKPRTGRPRPQVVLRYEDLQRARYDAEYHGDERTA